VRRRPVVAAVPLLGLLPVASAASPAATPGRKVLRVAIPSPETALDPVQTNSDSYTNLLLAQIFESPLSYDHLARPVALALGTAAAMPVVSADGRVFNVRLQSGIYFADDPAFKGKARELTAEDYVYGIKRFFDPRYNSSDLYIYEALKIPGLAELRETAIKQKLPFDYDKPAAGLRALDRYTLRIELGVADPRFLYQFADPVLMPAVAREVVQFYGEQIAEHPVGTGAFVLKQWRRGSRITLHKSPNYRAVSYSGNPAADPVAQAAAAHLAGKKLPLVDAVEVDVIEESQPRWLAFLGSQHDLMLVPGDYRPMAAPGGKLAPYLAKRGVQLQRSLQADMGMSFFFMEHPLVGGYTPDKVALRRAIGLAFDNRAYRQHVFGGYGIDAQSTVGPHTSGYDANYKSEMSEFSPAKAKALLDMHGYVDKDGDGWREQPSGQPLTLVMACLASQRDRRSNEVWKRCMDAVGLKMEFDISTWPELLKKSRAGSLMMWGYGWSATSPDGSFFLAIAYGPNAAESNDPRFSLPAFDRLYERQRALPDGSERDDVMRQAKNMLVAYMPFKVHQHSVYIDLVHPWVRGYWRHPFMRDAWRYVDVDATRAVPGAL
jgi:ABC-type transport system substrate-binding protein